MAATFTLLEDDSVQLDLASLRSLFLHSRQFLRVDLVEPADVVADDFALNVSGQVAEVTLDDFS